MLPTWDPNRLKRKIPFNLGLVGGRRQGKSTAICDLLWKMKSKFDLVICFIGSAACNPILSLILEQYYDPRFFFSKWEQVLLDKVLEQQEQLGGKTQHSDIS